MNKSILGDFEICISVPFAKQFFVTIFQKSLNNFRGEGQKWIGYKAKVNFLSRKE